MQLQERITTQRAIEILQFLTYSYRGKRCNKKHERKLKNLLCNAVDRHQRPRVLLATIWPNENAGATISKLTDFIKQYFRDHPIQDGMKLNAAGEVLPVSRSRGTPLFVWVKEQKAKDANDNFSDSGKHWHLAFSYDAKHSRRGFIKEMFEAAIAAGIIKAPNEKCPRPFFITGDRDISTQEDLEDASHHLVRYCAKPQTKDDSEKRNIGGSKLNNLYFEKASNDESYHRSRTATAD